MWQPRARRAWRRRALALGAALLLAWAVLPRAPATVRISHYFADVQPDALAHYLADFSNHVLLYPQPESWTIESQWSNFTWWRYEVLYECGARCSGRVAVSALREHAPGGPRHGAARAHRVLARDVRCTRLLRALPWPALCEETETETLIEGEGEGEAERKMEGSRLTESAAARCSLLAALLSRCAAAPQLAARHRLRLRTLSAALAGRR